jgi:Ca2+-binding EF-hand superfamily protein
LRPPYLKFNPAGIEVIDENEFLTWIKQIQELRPESKGEDDGSKELMEAFRVFDLDNNGYITRDELRTAMEKIGEPVTEMQLTEFINLADTDKDGRINYEGTGRLSKNTSNQSVCRICATAVVKAARPP